MSTVPRVITATVGAWLTGDTYGPQHLDGDPQRVIGTVLGYSSGNMERYGWTRIGNADITVTLVDEKQMVSNKLEALRVEKTTVLAEAQAKATKIEQQIQTLLAITYDGSAE